MTISEQIKVLCVRCGVSEAELARRLGKSPQSFNSKMKRESFTVEDLEKIADVLGVEFNREFIFINGQMIMIKTHVIHIREISAQMMERVLFVEM